MMAPDDPPPASPTAAAANTAGRRMGDIQWFRDQRLRVSKVMQDSDRSVTMTIPLRLSGIVLLWVSGVGLVTWQSFGGPSIAGETWGVVLVCSAATLSVTHVITQHNRMLRQAFEFGVETGRKDAAAELHAVR